MDPTDRQADAIRPFLENGAAAPFDRARVAVLPVACEATVTYGRGASRGPAAILHASTQLELYDEQSGSEPFRCGIWTDASIGGCDESPEQVVRRVARRTGELLDAGKWVVILGGDHSITPGGVEAAARRFDGLRVVQLDAHADLRETYQGSRWSHACATSRCLELAPVLALGVRSYSAEEARRIRRGIDGYRVVHAWEMQGRGWLERVLSDLEDRPVYLTVDLDYFDPSVMPATGTPEPGGGSWWPTLEFLRRLFEVSRVVACDVVELAPVAGLCHADYTAARLVYKLIGFAFRR